MEEKMVMLYLHPAYKAGMIPVSRVRKLRGKTVRTLICWFDAPGAWNADTWNVHIDGCDYECGSLEECKSIPPRIYGFKNVEYVETDKVWVWQ